MTALPNGSRMPSQTNHAADAAVAKVRRILDGIDREEGEPNGWWETSHGADMGAKKLAELESFIRTLLGGIDDSQIREFADGDGLLKWLESPDDENEGVA